MRMRILASAALAVLFAACAVPVVRLMPESVPPSQQATLRWRGSIELPLKLYEIDDLSADYPGVKAADYLLPAGSHALRFLYFKEVRFGQSQGNYVFGSNFSLLTDSLLHVEFVAEAGHTYIVNAVLLNHVEPQYIAGELELRQPGEVEVGVFDHFTKEKKASASLPLRYETRTKPGTK
jgi:hypothetical protein